MVGIWLTASERIVWAPGQGREKQISLFLWEIEFVLLGQSDNNGLFKICPTTGRHWLISVILFSRLTDYVSI